MGLRQTFDYAFKKAAGYNTQEEGNDLQNLYVVMNHHARTAAPPGRLTQKTQKIYDLIQISQSIFFFFHFKLSRCYLCFYLNLCYFCQQVKPRSVGPYKLVSNSSSSSSSYNLSYGLDYKNLTFPFFLAQIFLSFTLVPVKFFFFLFLKNKGENHSLRNHLVQQ